MDIIERLQILDACAPAIAYVVALQERGVTSEAQLFAAADAHWQAWCVGRKLAPQHTEALAAATLAAMADVLRTHADWRVRRAVVRHPRATPQMLLVGARDAEVWEVRYTAVSHPNATVEVLLVGAQDESLDVRLAAVQHPRATPEVRLLAEQAKNAR